MLLNVEKSVWKEKMNVLALLRYRPPKALIANNARIPFILPRTPSVYRYILVIITLITFQLNLPSTMQEIHCK